MWIYTAAARECAVRRTGPPNCACQRPRPGTIVRRLCNAGLRLLPRRMRPPTSLIARRCRTTGRGAVCRSPRRRRRRSLTIFSAFACSVRSATSIRSRRGRRMTSRNSATSSTTSNSASSRRRQERYRELAQQVGLNVRDDKGPAIPQRGTEARSERPHDSVARALHSVSAPNPRHSACCAAARLRSKATTIHANRSCSG